jgi:hypothetical protein
MKHYFIINPKAGPIDTSNQLISEIKDVFAGLDYEIYITKSVNDAYLHLSTIVKNLTVETCFYACGGDGTSYEVINAIMNHPLARFAVIPIGSCNDYLKSYPDYNFRNLKGYVNGKLLPIDVLKANDYYAVNEVNIGYDARANYDCCRYKKKIKKVRESLLLKAKQKKCEDLIYLANMVDEIVLDKSFEKEDLITLIKELSNKKVDPNIIKKFLNINKEAVINNLVLFDYAFIKTLDSLNDDNVDIYYYITLLKIFYTSRVKKHKYMCLLDEYEDNKFVEEIKNLLNGVKRSLKGAKKVTIPKAGATSKKIKKLKAKKKYYVRIRTYKKVNGRSYYSAWSAKKSKRTK